MKKVYFAMAMALLPIRARSQIPDPPTFNAMAACCFGVSRAKLQMLVQAECTSKTPKFSQWTCEPNRTAQEIQRYRVERLRGYLLSLPDPLPLSQLYAIKQGEADVVALMSNTDKKFLDHDLKRIFRCTAVLQKIP